MENVKEVELDPTTGLPVLGDELMWNVRDKYDNGHLAVDIVREKEISFFREQEVEVKGFWGPKTVIRAVPVTEKRYTRLYSEYLGDTFHFEMRADGKGYYGPADEDIEEFNKLLEQGAATSHSGSGMSCTLTLYWEPTKENVLKAALKAYERYTEDLEERKNRQLLKEKSADLLGLYPPKTLN